MKQKAFWIRLVSIKFKQSVPSEIVGQVFCSDTLEAAHPLIQARVVGVDVLDVENVLLVASTGGIVERLMRNGFGFRYR